MIYTNLDNFYVSKEDLQNSPSRQDGVSQETETELRIFGTTLIQTGGCLLQLPQVVMATGQVLFHRFFCKESMARFDVEKVAWTCCWLATKLEEIPRRVRDVLAVFYRLQRRRQDLPLEPLDFYKQEYENMKLELIRVERMMLREFGFIVHVEHPHKLVLNHLHMMLGSGHQDLMQEAWNLTNDSLRTTLCVRLKSEVVACGIIFMAARRLRVPLPEEPPWWELHNVTFEDICEVCAEVHSLYQRPPARYVAVVQTGRAGSAAATPQASLLTGQGSPVNSLGPAAAASGHGAAAVDSSVQRLEPPQMMDADEAPLQNGGDVKAAPGKDREENGKQHRPERRRSKDRERVREGREHERGSHRDRDGREREARGRERERDSRSERSDRDWEGRQERDRVHRDRGAERARPDERASRREGASQPSRSRRDAAEAGHKRSRAEDPREQHERESRRVRVVEHSDRSRDRADRPTAALAGSSDKGMNRWRSDAYRHSHSSSSALHQDSERTAKGGGTELLFDRNHVENRPVSERLTGAADRETRRFDERLQKSGKPLQQAARSMSDSPRSSRANGRVDGGPERFASPGDSVEGNGASRSAQAIERGSPSDQDRSAQNGSAGGARRLKEVVRSRSRSNSVDVNYPQSPGSSLKDR